MPSVWPATQKAVFDLLVADAGVHALVADRIYDGVPEDVQTPFIAFGPSDLTIVTDACGETHRGERLQIEAWASDHARLWRCKAICDAIKVALHQASAEIDPGALVSIEVVSMSVRPDPDGIMAQGLVSLQIEVEETGQP
jgi:hypothetical protein